MIIDLHYSKNNDFFVVRKTTQISVYTKNESGAYKRTQFRDFKSEEDAQRVYEDVCKKVDGEVE